MKMVLGKKVTTILEPSTELKDELTLTTDRAFNYSAYVLKQSQINGTESGSLIADLPKNSNIHKFEKVLDKYHRQIKDSEILESVQNNIQHKFYMDSFNTLTASKIERQNGITFNVRGDVAANLALQGNMLVQCNQSVCLVFIPKKITVDFNKFMFKNRGE